MDTITEENDSGEAAYRVNLEDLFEGPMDLLVHLIRKNELDIYDIPIAFITERFLAYIDWMKAMNINVAADFLVMAATLAHIKSKTLLPDAKPESEDEEDPRDAIAGPLIEYIRMKAAAEALAQRNVLNLNVFASPGIQAPKPPSPGEKPVEADVYELARAWRDMVEKASPALSYEITPERISVKDRMTEILDRLEKNGSIRFSDAVFHASEKSDVVISFLAVLELARLDLVRIPESAETGDFTLYAL